MFFESLDKLIKVVLLANYVNIEDTLKEKKDLETFVSLTNRGLLIQYFFLLHWKCYYIGSYEIINIQVVQFIVIY